MDFMSDHFELMQYRISRSWESYSAAKSLIELDLYISAMNRIYYACFYMVTVLLLTKNLTSTKHSGIKSIFNKEFINEGLIDKKWGPFYAELYQERQEYDYADYAEVDKEISSYYLKEAEVFLKEIESYINQKLGKN
jgi:uncharacterized protein (UPF0332 family)